MKNRKLQLGGESREQHTVCANERNRDRDRVGEGQYYIQ